MTRQTRFRTPVKFVAALGAASILIASCAAAPSDSDDPSGVDVLGPAAGARPPGAGSESLGGGTAHPPKTPAPPKPGAPEPTPPKPTPPKPGTPAPSTYVAKGERLGIANCPIYPRNNVFHADITSLPVLPNSAAIIKAAGSDEIVRSAFKARVNQGSRGGYPINIVDSSTMKHSRVWGLAFGGMKDLGKHPIPKDPRVEGYPGVAWDQHLLLFDTATCTSHEFFLFRKPIGFSDWAADMGVRLDVTSNDVHGRTSVASGFSLLAGMVRYDEVLAGKIDHAVAIGLPTISALPPVWPATYTDGVSKLPNTPRMGMMFRLRSDVDLSGLGRTARMMAEAMQTHGAILKDTNLSGMAINGENDHRWDDDDLSTLKQLTIADFEVVDPTSMKVADDSWEIR
ncbi:MAG TPA: hypothetical protein VL068_06020 [Microthrixaceae bacterium]|nr:hypothetical protein [Microthrixaceae bacterium]